MGGLETGRLTDGADAETKTPASCELASAGENRAENENARELLAGERWMQFKL